MISTYKEFAMFKPSLPKRSTLRDSAIKKLIVATRRGDHRAAQLLANAGVCPGCLTQEVRYRWAYIADGRRQIRAECVKCDRFLKWARHTRKIMVRTLEPHEVTP
jgi:hypothetical protein